ncbi:uncharacterized protein JCM10292_007742 [Rhodotorula paludigena]|uniref:uncharacterized protein n=1 Tax=Rhodotorula paludigena TaxID=86838 RepID=UPI00317ABE18
MPFENPLLPVLDAISPYLPSSLSDPLYTLASLDVVALRDHPGQLVPLLLSLLAAYTAFLSFLSSARWAIRTTLALLKLGVVAAVVSAVYLGYQGAGTEQGVTGGVRDAAGYASSVGQTAYSLGRRGLGYYFSPGAGSSRAQSNTQARDRRRATTGRTSSRGWSDRSGDGAGTDDFVNQALNGVLEFLNPSAGEAQDRVKRTAKKAKQEQQAGGSGGGLGGLAWDLAMGRAKKAWDDVVESTDADKNSKKRRW